MNPASPSPEMTDAVREVPDETRCGVRRDSAFQETRWSLVQRASGDHPTGAAAAVDELCRLCWFPLFAYARRKGSPPEQAEDTVQSFLADACARSLFTKPDPAKGRLRNFLLTAFDRWSITRWHHDHAQIRGGRSERIPLDLAEAEASYQRQDAASLTPEQLYHRQWATGLLESAAEAVRAEYHETGRGLVFDCLSPVLEGEAPAGGYAAAALVLDMTENAARQAAHRLRQAYRRELTRAVALTMGRTGEEVGPDDLAALREMLEFT